MESLINGKIVSKWHQHLSVIFPVGPIKFTHVYNVANLILQTKLRTLRLHFLQKRNIFASATSLPSLKYFIKHQQSKFNNISLIPLQGILIGGALHYFFELSLWKFRFGASRNLWSWCDAVWNGTWLFGSLWFTIELEIFIFWNECWCYSGKEEYDITDESFSSASACFQSSSDSATFKNFSLMRALLYIVARIQ